MMGRSALKPTREIACSMEVTFWGMPMKAELARRRILPARTESFLTSSATEAKLECSPSMSQTASMANTGRVGSLSAQK